MGGGYSIITTADGRHIDTRYETATHEGFGSIDPYFKARQDLYRDRNVKLVSAPRAVLGGNLYMKTGSIANFNFNGRRAGW